MLFECLLKANNFRNMEQINLSEFSDAQRTAERSYLLNKISISRGRVTTIQNHLSTTFVFIQRKTPPQKEKIKHTRVLSRY